MVAGEYAAKRGSYWLSESAARGTQSGRTALKGNEAGSVDLRFIAGAGWKHEWLVSRKRSTVWPMRFEMCVVLINFGGCNRARSGNGAVSYSRG